MRVKTVFMIAFALVLLVSNASAAWLSGYDFRTPINIQTSDDVNGYMTNVILQGNSPTEAGYIDFDAVNAGVLRFTNTDGQTELDYYVEYWNTTDKTASVWIKLPNVAITTPEYYKFSVSDYNHDTYGCTHPITYEFRLPAGSAGLTAYVKYTDAGDWEAITEKTPSDFYNGDEAVRFDYTNNTAYVSVGYAATSDNLFIKIDGGSGNVGEYLKVSNYYDNRDAAVLITGDDWGLSVGEDANFTAFCDLCQEHRLWFTPAVVTGKGYTNWSLIQSEIDQGYVQVASHARTHVNTPYNTAYSEIEGSKQDILSNLTMIANDRRGSTQYLYAFVSPGGSSDAAARYQLGQSKYLADRSTSQSITSISTWDYTNGIYNRAGTTIESDDHEIESWAPVFPGTDTLNSTFNTTLAKNGVYTLYMHPRTITVAQLEPHFIHLANRTNVWYTGLGDLYAYTYFKQFASKPIAVSDQSIYAYYGGSESTSASSYTNTHTQNFSMPNIAAQWLFSEGVGSAIADTSGYENDGNAFNMNWLDEDASGLSGHAIAFNGVNSSANVSSDDALNLSGSMSIECSVYQVNRTGYQRVINKVHNTAGKSTYMISVYDGVPRFTSDDLTPSSVSATAISPNTWYNITCTYDGNCVRIYVNGVLIREQNVTGTVSLSTKSLEIGRFDAANGQYFNGSIDNVRLYNRALTPEEVLAHQNNINYDVNRSQPITTITQNNIASKGLVFSGVENTIDSDNIVTFSSVPSIGSMITDLTVIPSADTVNVSVTSWTTDSKVWNESSESHSISTTHIIGGFPANTDIDIYRDGIDYATVTSNSTGYITWVYSGGFSEHTFEAIPHATAGVRDSFVSSWGNTVSMVGAIIVIALAGSMIMMFRGKKDLSEVMNDLPGILLIVVLLVTGAIIFGQF